MSLIQRIRDKAAWFVFGAIALSLIAFILQDAFYGRGRGGGWFSDNTTDVAVVNGKKIDAVTLSERVKMMEDMYRQYGMNVDEGMRNNLQTQMFNSIVATTLSNQQAAKLGLAITDKEFSEMLFGANPPDFIQELGRNQQTGQFDIEQARQQFNNLKKQKGSELIDNWYKYRVTPYRESMLQQKYAALLDKSNYVPKWLAEKTLAENNTVAKAQFVVIPYSTVSDSLKVTDADISDFIKRKAKIYENPEETRSIEYVSFDASASSQDSAAIYATLVALKPEFQSASDANAFLVKNNSKMPYFDGFQLKNKIQIPVKDSLFGLSNGSVYGPYLDGNSFVVAKMIDKRTMPDSVKVRHILIGTVDPQSGTVVRTDSAAKKLADSIQLAIAKGSNFDSLCVKFSDDKGSTAKGGVYEMGSMDFSRFVKEFSEEAFYQKAGDKRVVKTQFGYHYMEVVSQKNFEEAYKIAYLAKEIFASDETINNAQTKANQFAAAAKNYKAFTEEIAKDKYNKLFAEDLKKFDAMVASLGTSRDVVRWAFTASKGDISEVKRVDDKFVVCALTRIKEKGLPAVEDIRSKVENLVRNELKAKEIIKKYSASTTLEDLAAKSGQTVMSADSIAYSSGIAPNIGNEPKVVGYAFNKEGLNKVSPGIAGNGGVFFVKPLAQTAVSNNLVNADDFRKQLAGQLGSSAATVFDAIKRKADIKDYRLKFNY